METEEYNFKQIKVIHSTVQVLESAFSQDIASTSLPVATEKFQPCNSLATERNHTLKMKDTLQIFSENQNERNHQHTSSSKKKKFFRK